MAYNINMKNCYQVKLRFADGERDHTIYVNGHIKEKVVNKAYGLKSQNAVLKAIIHEFYSYQSIADLEERVKECARMNDKSFSKYVRDILTAYFEEKS
jgi:hypothetical protein